MACVSRGERSGGFKCIFCQQHIPYVKESFTCKNCGHNHLIYFRKQKTSLRDEVRDLEELLSQQDKNKSIPEQKEKDQKGDNIEKCAMVRLFHLASNSLQ